MQHYQTSDEIIKEAKKLFAETGEGFKYEPHYVIGYLKQAYDSLLESISRDTRE